MVVEIQVRVHSTLDIQPFCAHHLTFHKLILKHKLFCVSILFYTETNHLNTGQVSNFPNMLGCQMVRFSNRGLKPGEKVSEKSHLWIMGVQYSDGYCIHIFFVIQ